MIARIIAAIIGFIEIIIGLRFIFLLIGANPNSQFVSWIYDWSNLAENVEFECFSTSIQLLGSPFPTSPSMNTWLRLSNSTSHGHFAGDPALRRP